MNITFSIDQLEEVAQKIIAEKPNKIILSWRKWAWVKPLIKQLCLTLGVTAQQTVRLFFGQRI
jgi:tRNA threonylcarbamoyladenosine biosynthesis protein TsaE